MFNPLTILILLLVGAGATALTARAQPSLARPIAAGAILLVLLWWLASFTRLPLSIATESRPGAIVFSPVSWYVDRPIWLLSGAVLLLVLMSILYDTRDKTAPPLPPLRQALPLLLALATLATLWTNSLAGLLSGGTILTIVWAATLSVNLKTKELWWRTGALWFSLFFIWLSLAALPQVTPIPEWNLQGWPPLARSLLLLASVLLIGVYPLSWWRPSVTLLEPGLAVLLWTLPTAVGAALLSRLEAGSSISVGFALPLTLLGFAALLAGIASSWRQRDQLQQAAAALILAQAGILVLVGVWAGPEAILAEARVLLLAGGMLLLASRLPVRSLPARAGLLLAALALTAFPLTAGFAGRAELYDTWLAHGRGILVLASALLHLPLASAAIVVAGGRPMARNFTFSRSDLYPTLPLLIGLPGLFSLSGLSGTSLLAWLALLLPPVAGFALASFPNLVREGENLFQEALSLRSPAFSWRPSWHLGSHSLSQAFRQASDLLEGEGGMLWLLLFLIIVWLAQ